jgi:hypothetical protein
MRDVPVKYYHRQNFPNNGTRALNFFNAARALGVSNLPQAGQISANTYFLLKAIRFDVLPGIDVNGARTTVSATALKTAMSGGAAGAVATDTLISAQWKWQEKLRELFETAVVTFSVNNRPVNEICKLSSFPSGTGIHASMTSDTGATLTAQAQVSHFSAHISNGAPLTANGFWFPTPYPMPGGSTFQLQAQWLTAVDFTDASLGPLTGETAGNPMGTIIAELEGTEITPASAG